MLEHHQVRRFWATAARDGLLPDGVDVDWLGDTAAILSAADTFLHITRTLGWGPDEYEGWLLRTWRGLLGSPA
jgi:hypothetical protein